MKRVLILLIAASMAFPQDKPAETKQDKPAETKEPFVAVIIPVRTLTGDSFERLVTLLSVFGSQGAQIKGSATLRTIVVYGPKEVGDQVRRVVEQLDTPGSEAAIGLNIDMTLTLLRCSTKAPAEQSPLPPDMESVARQLRIATQYKDIQVWDVVPMRIQEGRDTRETLKMPGAVRGGEIFASATINLHPEAVYRKDQGRYVRFSRLNVDFRIPTANNNGQFSFFDVGLQTAGDFMEGQKTVVGKVSGTGDDDAIFAVIALKVLD